MLLWQKMQLCIFEKKIMPYVLLWPEASTLCFLHNLANSTTEHKSDRTPQSYNTSGTYHTSWNLVWHCEQLLNSYVLLTLWGRPRQAQASYKDNLVLSSGNRDLITYSYGATARNIFPSCWAWSIVCETQLWGMCGDSFRSLSQVIITTAT